MVIVVDTNVLLSGILFEKSNPGLIMESFYNREVQLVFCHETALELLDKYPKVALKVGGDELWISEFERIVKENARIINFVPEANVCRDPKDNIFLDTVFFGKADFLVTGDRDLLVLKKYKKIPIVTPAEFLKRIG